MDMEVESSTKVEKPIIENSEYDTRMYGYDENKLEAAKSQKLWMKDPKYFKRVKISPSATIKMMAHAQSGVDKGIKKGGNPIEVMGLLLGRLDVDDPNAFIVSDIFPVPAEGFETTVVTDNEEVMNYMLEVRDIAELSRKENIFGWYHTHPFDYDPSSSTGHCFLSNTDVTTQLQWQRMEDSQGATPWLAIVIDPLRSIAKGKPELAAFRVYPPEYEPLDNETPDGKIVVDKAVREKLWGNCWRRYYKLEVQYFMSTLAQQTFRILKNELSWSEPLTKLLSKESDFVATEIEKVNDTVKVLNQGYSSTLLKVNGDMSDSPDDLRDKIDSVVDHAVDKCKNCSTNFLKHQFIMDILSKPRIKK